MQSSKKTVYQLTRSKRKTLALHVQNATLHVRAPENMPLIEIEHFIHKKHAWINNKIQLQAEKMAQLQHNTPRTHIRLLDETLELSINYQSQHAIVRKDQQLHINAADDAQSISLINAWLSTQAQDYMIPRCMQLAQQMQVEEQISAIAFKKTKSKWGHCTRTGKLQFNPLIMMAPAAVVDYLLIHELAHLTHMNHSHAFWQHVKNFCPDYLYHRRWLKDNGHSLWL